MSENSLVMSRCLDPVAMVTLFVWYAFVHYAFVSDTKMLRLKCSIFSTEMLGLPPKSD